MDKEKRREYWKRQNYKKIPLSDQDWSAYRLHAAEHDSTRTAFLAAVLRDYLANPHPLKLTAREKTWAHAQKGTKRMDPVDEALLRIRLQKTFAAGRLSPDDLQRAHSGKHTTYGKVDLEEE
jgi:hypothetical protein